MKIDLNWLPTIVLEDGSAQNMLFLLPQRCILPSDPGIYIFGRKHGDCVSAIYIGKADNIERRVEQQLNNVKLMMALRNSGAGNKILLYGRIVAKQGHQVKKIIKWIEPHFIEFAKLSGNALVNVKGMRPSFHEVINKGNLDVRQILALRMNIKEK